MNNTYHFGLTPLPSGQALRCQLKPLSLSVLALLGAFVNDEHAAGTDIACQLRAAFAEFGPCRPASAHSCAACGVYLAEAQRQGDPINLARLAVYPEPICRTCADFFPHFGYACQSAHVVDMVNDLARDDRLPQDALGVADGEGASAGVNPGPLFGCIHWQARP